MHPDLAILEIEVPAPVLVAVVHLRQGGAIARRLDPGSERERVGPVKVGVITELDVVFAVDPEGFSELAVDPVAASLDSPFSAGVNRVRDDVALALVEREVMNQSGRLGRACFGFLLGLPDPGLELALGGFRSRGELCLRRLQGSLLFLHHGGASKVGDVDNRRLVASPALHARVGSLVEVGEEPIVVFL